MIKKYLIKAITLVIFTISVIAFNSTGASATWEQNSKGWWYTEGNSWATGWKLIDGNWYYFYSDGYMAKDKTIDGYYLNSSGVWINSIKTKDNGNGISINQLKNVENFKRGALEHILEGQINAAGEAVGFHYEGMPTAKGKIIQGTESTPNKFGVYTAKIEVNGVPKADNEGFSSFFPKSWSAQDVVDGINQAYNNRVFKAENEFYGYTSNQIKIEMYIDLNTRQIISAFPAYL